MLTKSNIEKVFKNENDYVKMNAVGRALVVLYKNQTKDEQNAEMTKYHNNMGFNSSDAKKGTGMAKFYLRNKYLTEKQVNYWLTPTKTRSSRIIKYWEQLAIAAEEKKKNVS